MLKYGIVRKIIYGFITLVCLTAGFVGYTILSLPDVRTLIDHTPPTTSFIEYRKSVAETEKKPLKIRHRWLALAQIPRLVQRTIVVSEDAAFWVHEGIDWFEMQTAVKDYLKEGKELRGASTISQQTVKNLYLTPDRSFYRKIREYLITQELEKHLPKKRILELYLNSIEFGSGVFGINSASWFYFGESPKNLSIFEIARLTAIIPRPLTLSPKKNTKALKWRTKEIIHRLHRFKWIEADEYQQAMTEFNHFFDIAPSPKKNLPKTEIQR